MEFEQLHRQHTPLLLANVWDVRSAKVAETLNFQAMGTSSAAMAAAMGYQDGGEMPFDELLYLVQRIRKNTNLPLSVDIESGHGRTAKEIATNIKRLAEIGVAGINIEDSIVTGSRNLLDADAFASILSEITENLRNEKVGMFINVRTDTFLLGIPNVLEETIKRIKRYEDAGANGIFVPCIEDASAIREVIRCTELPLNVMCMPNLPDFDMLNTLGVKRISMGNFVFDWMYNQFETKTKEILQQKSFNPIF